MDCSVSNVVDWEMTQQGGLVVAISCQARMSRRLGSWTMCLDTTCAQLICTLQVRTLGAYRHMQISTLSCSKRQFQASSDGEMEGGSPSARIMATDVHSNGSARQNAGTVIGPATVLYRRH